MPGPRNRRMPKCTKCQLFKSRDAFGKNREKSNGLQSWCKDCQRATQRLYDCSDEGKAVRYLYNQSDEGKARKRLYDCSAKGKACDRRTREKYPDRIKARAAVGYALKTGELTKGSCAHAGRGACRGQIEAHHWSYEKRYWLDVEWLCECHHDIEDIRIGTRLSLVAPIP